MTARVRLKKQQVAVRKKQAYFKPEYNEQVERLCKLGVTDYEVARFFNVTRRTVANWKHNHPEFFVALQKGKLEADNEVAAALFKNAIGFTYQQETIVKKKCSSTKNGVVKTWEELERIFVEQHSLPITTAQIFYLKNRRPDLFRDVKPFNPEEGEPEKVYVTPDEVLEEMKRRGIVMIEGAYSVVEK